MELGNHEEANEELELIDAPLRVHPDVLEVRWLIHQKVENWELCENIGTAPAHPVISDSQSSRLANICFCLMSSSQYQNTMSVKFRVASCEDFIDHVAVNVGEAALDTVVVEGEVFVIEAK